MGRSLTDAEARAVQVIDILDNQLTELEAIGALIAAAHVDAAIEACRKQFPATRTSSTQE